jgi:thymidine phosphorylase
LEVIESLDVLGGGGPPDLRELCLELSGWMFHLSGRVVSVAAGRQLAAEQITSGRAKAKFREIISAQNGDASMVDDFGRLPAAGHTLDVLSPARGYVAATECYQLGVACVVLGAGREKKEDAIDPAAGLVFHKKRGDAVDRGEPLCTLHYNSAARVDEARRLVESSYRITAEPPAARPLIHRFIGV